MKTIQVFIIMGLLAILGFGCKTNPITSDTVNRPAPEGKLVGFTYTHSGTMSQPFEDYELKLDENGKVTLFAHHLGEIHDTVEVDSTVLEQVAQMILKNEVYKYKDRYEPPMEVLDGEGWRYSAEYDDGTSLSSSGSNARPSNFVLPAIGTYLDSVAVKAGAQNKGEENWY